jgi:hypothetical protein
VSRDEQVIGDAKVSPATSVIGPATKGIVAGEELLTLGRS